MTNSMNHSVKITNVEAVFSQADQTHSLEVTIEVSREEGEKVESLGIRKFGYPLGTTKEEIKADLQKVASTLDSDAEIALQTAETDRQLTEVQSLKKELLDEEESK